MSLSSSLKFTNTLRGFRALYLYFEIYLKYSRNITYSRERMIFTMATWTVDASHTSVGFSVKHMMVSKVKGSFGAVEGALEGNPEDLTGGKNQFQNRCCLHQYK